MTTIQDIKNNLKKAESWLEKMVKDLDQFMKKENLESFEKMWGMEELKRKMKNLEESKEGWDKEVQGWYRKLREVEGKGNEQIV